MDKPTLHIIKTGGNIIDDEQLLVAFIQQLSLLQEPFILVHGGGKLATSLSNKLGIETHMLDGRRVTDAQTLDVVTMVYAGLINKKIVAQLQANGKNAIGLSGADANIIPATIRQKTILDYGFVGDVSAENIAIDKLQLFINNSCFPVISPITHNGKGQLLNTNADTIASSVAIALTQLYKVNLYYCFEKNGVLKDSNDDGSVMEELSSEHYLKLKDESSIHSGMIPKLDNAFDALKQSVSQVYILHAMQLINLFNKQHAGTKLVK
jgi:acetylglutamate kinase